MVKIRLIRTGKRNSPTYRVAVLDRRTKAKGTDPIEEIGFFNPSLKKDGFKYDEGRYKYWLDQGAKPTKSILALIEGKYKYIKYSPKKDANPPTEIAPKEQTESA